MMTPEVAAEAIRTYVEESNRINHQRRAQKSPIERICRKSSRRSTAL
ncbi:hypothetical protein [Sphingobium sp. Ant17]|nr:hypothetical protein [Sphingobium sp. Ant17]